MTIHTAFQSVYKSLIGISLLAILSACGGGGSSGPKAPTPDSSPDAFTIAAVTNAAVKTDVTSSAITIGGINQAAAISITGGTYSIGGATYTDAAGTVTNGQAVTVKVTSSDKTNTAVTATLTIGGVSGQFKVTTLTDVTPDTFTFTAVKDVAPKSVNTSTAITVAGVDIAVPISITNGEYSINDGAYTSAAGTVSNGQKVIVRATVSDKASTDVIAALTIGGVTANYKVTTYADTAAPTAQILFPPPVSMTEGNTILVRGTASDELSTIVSVKVNGVLATTTDGYKNWQALVPLIDTISPVTTTTENNLFVITEDSAGNKSPKAAQVSIRQASLDDSFPDANNRFSSYIWNTALDKSNGHNRLLVIDQSTKVFSVDLDTSQRTIFSNISNACQYTAVAINPLNSHLYASCYDSYIYDFDLLDSSKFQIHSSPLYKGINSILWSSVNGAAKFATVSYDDGVILTADQALSNPIVFSDAAKSIPNALNPINHSASGIAYDKDRNRYLVSDYSQQIIFSVDAVSGERTILSSNTVGSGEHFASGGDTYLSGVAVDDVNHRLIVTDGETGNLFAVDLITGNRKIISGNTSDNPFNKLAKSYTVTIVDPNGYAFLSDYAIRGIYAVDLVTGHRVVFNKD